MALVAVAGKTPEELPINNTPDGSDVILGQTPGGQVYHAYQNSISGGQQKTVNIVVATDGQTSFTLPDTPINTQNSELTYELCNQTFGEFYSITGNVLNIIGMLPFPICSGDKIQLKYNI